MRCAGVAAPALLLAALLAGCAPRLRPLGGDALHARLPQPSIPLGHRQVGFDWILNDQELSGRGEGVARIAGPDSVRLDFFLAGGFGAGAAIMIGDSLQLPGQDFVRRLLPPPAMLWAALGRSTIPALADTAIRADGPLLRADLGRPVEWRVTFRGDSLTRLERVEGGRVSAYVARDSTELRYRDERGRRTLTLRVTSLAEVPPFDASIWRFSR